MPDHERLLPQLLRQLAPGGALAFQIPANLGAPAHRLMRELAASAGWQQHFAAPVREWKAEEPSFYYDVLAPHSARVDVWITEYLHVMESVASIVEWYRGTGLRPWLNALPNAATREAFTEQYRASLDRAFPLQSDGRVLFPFRRLFVIAYR